MTESDMTGSKLVFIDIDGTLADENHMAFRCLVWVSGSGGVVVPVG